MAIYVSTAEKKILLVIGKLMQENEPNINGKLIAKISGYSVNYVSEILNKLREKELITTINQAVQKIHFLSKTGKIAVFRLSAGYSGQRTSQRTSDYDKSLRKWKVRIRPHDFRFKAEVLGGPPFPDRWMPTYHMDGLVGNVCYDYEVTCMFYQSQKTQKRYIVLRVPSFFADDFSTTIFEAHQYAKRTLEQLTQDHGYKFSDLTYIYSHLAVSNDPVTHFSSDDISFIRSENGRLQFDRSRGPEFEAITKLGPEDMQLIFDEVFGPVIEREYSPQAMLKNIQIFLRQIRTDQEMFAHNLKEHVKLVSALVKAAEALTSAVQQQKEQKKEKEKGILEKIRKSGQKLLEDFL